MKQYPLDKRSYSDNFSTPDVRDSQPKRIKMPPTITQDDLDNRFTYHPPKGNQADRYVFLRDQAKALAMMIVNDTPPSREQSLSITHLEEAIFWANAAIARNE